MSREHVVEHVVEHVCGCCREGQRSRGAAGYRNHAYMHVLTVPRVAQTQQGLFCCILL